MLSMANTGHVSLVQPRYFTFPHHLAQIQVLLFTCNADRPHSASLVDSARADRKAYMCTCTDHAHCSDGALPQRCIQYETDKSLIVALLVVREWPLVVGSCIARVLLPACLLYLLHLFLPTPVVSGVAGCGL